MKKFLFFFILILISCNVFASEKTSLPDSKISELIIGKWHLTLSDENMKLDTVDEYLPGGKMVQKGKLTVSGQDLDVALEATWKIENGKLISTLVSVEPEGMMPAGLTTTDTVVSIDKEKFVCSSDKTGEIQTYYRVSN